jgi:hypothetical protein
LKNILPIFVKIYFDAGLKELALKFHRGATLKVLTDCTNSEFVPKNINVFSTVSLLSAESSRIAIETKFDFSVSLSDEERYILRFGKIICFSFEKHCFEIPSWGNSQSFD